jgi:APA family basic amino acid/polyamine antiporter
MDPKTTIPKSIMVALSITLIVYLIIMGSTILTVDIETLANSKAPLVDAVKSGRFSSLSPMVRFGACFASLSVLLSLMAGISRTIFSMSAHLDLPGFFSAVHPKHKIPHRAELLVGIIVALVVGFADLRHAIGFSSFAILIYYTIANIAAFKLSTEHRLWPRGFTVFGALLCVGIAMMLPLNSILYGMVVFIVGAVTYWVTHKKSNSNI